MEVSVGAKIRMREEMRARGGGVEKSGAEDEGVG